MMRNAGAAAAAVLATAVVFSIRPVHSELAAKGLIHPVNHFPTWFSDTNGVTLQMCLDGDGLTGPCLFDEPIAGNAFSEVTGFGPEAFWWSADATLDLPNDAGAILVLALEAAYANEDPEDGDQFAFGRVRIRVDTPIAGHYRIWHPYLDPSKGCEPEVFNAPAGRRAINITRDVGGAAPFETMLQGEVGPFLVWDPAVAPAAPAGYVGDPQVEHPVVGSPCGFNYFRIEGPAGSNLDGQGGNIVQTNLFSVQGKIYRESDTPPAIQPVRGTYFRSSSSSGSTTARVNVWAEAPPSSLVSVTGLPQANQNGPMTHDGSGGFFRRSTLNSIYGSQVPAAVTVTATNAAGTASTSENVELVDQVSISAATWSPSARTLNVVATTSDRISPTVGTPPQLSLRIGSNVMTMPRSGSAGRHALTLSGIATPPASVTVTSSQGGSDTEPVAD